MKITYEKLFKAYQSGYHNLYNVYPEIDRLNIFPVPDGDTGTNLNLTISKAIQKIEIEKPKSITEISQCFSKGLIMSARGNSGVIFSQIFKGFGSKLNNPSIQANQLINAFIAAKEVSYNSVMKPIEGTILTVVRVIAEEITPLLDLENLKILDLFQKIVDIANDTLAKTKDMLPELKEAQVVDSGAYGLVKFLEGMNIFFQTNKIVIKNKKPKVLSDEKVLKDFVLEETYGYCTECVVLLNKKFINQLKTDHIRNVLQEQEGKSLVIVIEQDILKVHVHTRKPGFVISFLQKYGEFNDIKVDNMSLQAEKHHTLKSNYNRQLIKEYATITIVPTLELKSYFINELGVSHVIESPQMNPSVDEILESIYAVDAKEIYLLPNSGNVILACNQAAKMETESKVNVINSKSICEGMVSGINFDPTISSRKNLSQMRQAIRSVKTIHIFKAAKNTVMDSIIIKKDEYMSTINKKHISNHEDIMMVLQKSLSKYLNKSTEIVTFFISNNIGQNQINKISKYMDENFDIEYEFTNMGPHIYDIIIAVE